MAHCQPNSSGYIWNGQGNKNESGGTDHAAVHHGTTRETVGTGGADPRGQNQSRSASGSFSQGPQQPTEFDEQIQDDPIKIVFKQEKMPKNDWTIDSGIGTTDWLYLRSSIEPLQKLKKQLKTAGVILTDERAKSEIEVRYTGSYALRSGESVSKKMEVILGCFSTAITSLWRGRFAVEHDIRGTVLHMLQNSSFSKSHIGVGHRTHDGHFVLVCDKEHKEKVLAEWDYILETAQKLHCSSTTTAGDSCYEEFTECLLGSIPIDANVYQFLKGNLEAEDYLVSEFKKAGVDCKFQFSERKIDMIGFVRGTPDFKSLFSQLILHPTVDFSAKRVKNLFSMKEICMLLERRLQKEARKFQAFPISEDQIQLVAMKEVFPHCQDIIKKIEGDVVEECHDIERSRFAKLTSKEIGKIRDRGMQLSEGKVIIREYESTTKCGFHLCGTKAGVQDTKEEIERCLYSPTKLKIVWNISGPKLALMKASKKSVEYLEQKYKENDFLFEFDESRSQISVTLDKQRKEEAIPLLSKLIMSESYDMSKRRSVVASVHTVEEIAAMLLKEESLHKQKLLVEVIASTLILTGTQDIFPGIDDYLKEISSYESRQSVGSQGSLGLAGKLPIDDRDEDQDKVHGVESTKSIEGDHKVNETQVSEFISISMMTHILLTKRPEALNFVKSKLQSEGYGFEIDHETKKWRLTAKSNADSMRAKELLRSCFAEEEICYGDKHCVLTPSETQQLLEERPKLMTSLIVKAEDAKKRLLLCGTSSTFAKTLEVVNAILEDYSEDTKVMSLSKQELAFFSSHTPSLEHIQEKFQKKVVIELGDSKIMIRGAKCCLEECINEVQCMFHKKAEEKKRIYKKNDQFILPERLSPLVYGFLQKKVDMGYISEMIKDFGCIFKLEKDNIVMFSALTETAVENAYKLFTEMIIEREMTFTDKPFWLMLGVNGIREKLMSDEKIQQKLLIQGSEDGQMSLVCTNDVLSDVQDSLQKLEETYQLDTCNISDNPSCDEITVSHLEQELYKSDILSQETVKLFLRDRLLWIVSQVSYGDLAKKRLQLILKIKDNEWKIDQGTQHAEVKLSDLQFSLTVKPQVLNYIQEKLKTVNLLMTLKIETKCIWVFGLTREGTQEGEEIVKSCFKEKLFDFINDPLLQNVSLEDVKKMIELQYEVHQDKYVIHQVDKTLVLVSTDDVFLGILKTVESNTDEFVVCTPEQMEYISTFKKSDLSALERGGVRIILTNSSDVTEFEISGNDATIVKEAKKKLQDLCTMITVKSFPIRDEAKLQMLKSERGKEVIFDTQTDVKCLISLSDNAEYMDDHEETDIPVLEGIDLTKESPHWTAKEGKSGICVVGGNPMNLHADVFAFPVIENQVTAETQRLAQTGNVHDQLMAFSDANLEDKREDQAAKVHFVSPGKFKCQSVAYIQFLSLNEWGKRKEHVRNTVKNFLHECEKKGYVCIVIFLDFSDRKLFTKVTKQIVFAANETLKGMKPPFSMKICLLTVQEEQKNLQDILKASRSSFNKLKRKLKRKMEAFSSPSRPSGDTAGELQWKSPNIELQIGDLAQQDVDVVVNSVNAKLELSRGAISSSLNKATNSQLQKECKKKYPDGLQDRELAVTDSMGLKCKKVFHGCLKEYDDKGYAIQVLRELITQCLKKANEMKYSSLAFPVLGIGKLQYPLKEVVEVMFNTVELFSLDEEKSTLQKVVFVLYSDGKEETRKIIKTFQIEWMARCYQISSVKDRDAIREEARVDCGNTTIQVIEGNVTQCTGKSDGLICFWTHKHISNPARHPVLGKHINDIDWPDNAFQHGEVENTKGGGLPSRKITHVFLKTGKISEALFEGLKVASKQKLSIIQIPVPSKTDTKEDLKAVASALKTSLLDQKVSSQKVNVVTVVTPCKESFSTLVGYLRDSPSASGLIDALKHPVQTLQSWLPGASQEEEAKSEDEDCDPLLVITASSENDCKKAQHQVLTKICNIQSLGTSVDQQVHADDGGSQHVKDNTMQQKKKNYLKWTREVYILPVGEPNKYKEIFEQTDGVDSVETEVDEEGNFCIIGDLENISHAYQAMKRIEEDSSMSSGGARHKTTSEKKEVPVSVKCEHFEAAECFIGSEKLSKYCHVGDDPDQKGYKMVSFKITESNKHDVQAIQQRVLGVIQEELLVPNTDWSRGTAVAAEAMKGTDDVYIKYQEDKHTILLFAEDWDKMSKAKKRVQVQFGQTKISSRTRRKFAEPQSVQLERSESTEADVPGQKIIKGKLLTVKVYEADITTLHLDVVVNAANEQLSHGGGVARIIASKAGHKLIQEGNDILWKGTIPVTQLAVTTGGDLPCRKVFHAVGPRWHGYVDKNKCLEDLCYTVLRCLCEARNRGFTSIVFPSISASIFAVPHEQCAKMYVRALKSFDQTVEGGSLREVHFVDITDKMVTIIQEEIQKTWNQPGGEEELRKDTAFINKNLGSSGAWAQPSTGQHEKGTKPSETNLKDGYFKFSEDVSINIFQQDIFKSKCEILVSWENSGLHTSRHFVKELKTRGGEQYCSERNKLTYPISGDVIATKGGNLLQDHVIHAVVNSARVEEFTRSLREIFDMCVKRKCTEILLPVYNQMKSSGKSKKVLFLEAVVDTLLGLSRDDSRPVLHVHIVDTKQDVVADLCGTLYQYLISLGLAQKNTKTQKSDTEEVQTSGGNECPICFEPMVVSTKLKCGHLFCKPCIDEAFKTKCLCPICKTVCGIVTGNMPTGNMSVTTLQSSLKGYEGHKTICIHYSFPGGYQTADHPHPNQYYKGTTRDAYLPDTKEGQKVLALLKVAWDRKLTFTVGESVTIGGGGDRVTWNEIHHKTSMTGGPTNYGYPDPDYLKRVQEELAAQGVTEADIQKSGSKFYSF